MSPQKIEAADHSFSNDAIAQQIDKILSGARFRGSDILSHFLKFIVFETLKGRSNQLKEYTIALEVLHKPSDFNMRENGIVRIHASRLRRALSDYYTTIGTGDKIGITIPIGRYIPIFYDRSHSQWQSAWHQ